jgi:hypothetical protein
MLNSWTLLQLWITLVLLASHDRAVQSASIQANANQIGVINARFFQKFGFKTNKNDSIRARNFQNSNVLKKKNRGLSLLCAFLRLKSAGNVFQGASKLAVYAQKQIFLDLQCHALIPYNSSTQSRSAVSLQNLCSSPEFSQLRLGTYSLYVKRSACEAAFSRKIEYSREAVFLLDLDKCSFFGNDANDLGVAFQWTQKSRDQLVDLYRLLVNPSLSLTYNVLRQRHRTVRVVIYTMRSDFINYHSNCRPIIIPLEWKSEWHGESQVYFPPHLETVDEILGSLRANDLECQELFGLSKSLERLLIARQVIAEQLNLSSLPDLVVTASEKEVGKTVEHLGYAADRATLWDDNPALRGHPSVVSVPSYTRLPSDQHARLLAFLRRHLPAGALPADLVDFLMSADPEDRIVAEGGPAGELDYTLPCAPAPSHAWRAWPVPAPPAYRFPVRRAPRVRQLTAPPPPDVLPRQQS